MPSFPDNFAAKLQFTNFRSPTTWNSTSVAVLCLLAVSICDLYDFPGPYLGRASLLWRFKHHGTGQLPFSIEKLHRKYGPIVRIAPNELSFGSVESWKLIYGHPAQGKPIPIKSGFYDVLAAGLNRRDIISESDPDTHREMRKMLAPAFSSRALSEQQAIISKTVEKFIRVVGELGSPSSDGINLSKWYDMCTFDILGEMAFGESFHSIENQKPHYWSSLVFDHIIMLTVLDNLSRIRLLAKFFGQVLRFLVLRQERHAQQSILKTERLLLTQEPRKDFVSLMVQEVQRGEMDKEQMAAHVSSITLAGSETIGTSLASVTCFLLQNPRTLSKLSSEIRGAFPSYKDINLPEIQRLKYLQAVTTEGLRLFPPIAIGPPRLSPGFELHGHYIPRGTSIHTSFWSPHHDPQYFSGPMEFRPERWLDPNSNDNKQASQPFLLGPRDCIGKNFALMEMHLMLTKLIWKYDLELVNKNLDWFKEARGYTLWKKPKLIVRFHERKDVAG